MKISTLVSELKNIAKFVGDNAEIVVWDDTNLISLEVQKIIADSYGACTIILTEETKTRFSVANVLLLLESLYNSFGDCEIFITDESRELDYIDLQGDCGGNIVIVVE